MRKPYFRSDLHAEMDVMTKFETRFKDAETRKGFILYSSLEPCPMCFTRLVMSGINKVYYAAPDEMGGMVSRTTAMPPNWRHLAQKRKFGLAACSPELRHIAIQVFQSTSDAAFAMPIILHWYKRFVGLRFKAYIPRTVLKVLAVTVR